MTSFPRLIGATRRRKFKRISSSTRQADEVQSMFVGHCCVIPSSVLVLLLLLEAPLWALQRTGTQRTKLTLRHCIEQALAHNRDIKISRLSLNSSNLDVQSAEAIFSPTSFFGFTNGESRVPTATRSFVSDSFSTSASISKLLSTGGTISLSADNGVFYNPGRSVSQSVSISYAQPLLRDAGRSVTEASILISRNRSRLSTESLIQTVINTVTNVETSYWGFLLEQERLDIQARALDRSRELRTITEALIEAGRLAKNEILQAEADVASQEVIYIEAEQAVIIAENRLRDTLDSDLPSRLILETPEIVDPQPVDLSTSLSRAFRNRPDWKSAEIDIDNADIGLRVARRGRLYGLDLVFSLSAAGSGSGLNSALSNLPDNRSVSIGLQFDLPFNNAPNYNNYLAAQISREQTLLQVQELRQQIELEVDSAVRQVNLQLRQLGLTRRARALAEQSLNAEKEKLRVGRSTGFNVVRLQNDVNLALNDELLARVNYLLTRAELERAMGTTLQRWNIKIQAQ